MAQKQMADLSKYAIPDANSIRWTEATSKNGVRYRHGFLNTATTKASAGNEATRSEVVKASDDGVKVNWPLGTSNTFKSGDPVHNKCHITSYDFFANHKDLVYLKFSVDNGWERTFTDDLNDVYICATKPNGNHYIQFTSSSANPTICHVS